MATEDGTARGQAGDHAAGGIGELGLDHASERALRGERLLLVDALRKRVNDGTLDEVNGLGPKTTARVVDALERHHRAHKGRRKSPAAPNPYTTPTRGSAA